MNGLFSIPPAAATSVRSTELPLCKEVAWDFSTNSPLFSNGEPVIAEGAAAVAVWIMHALHTARGRHRIYTRDFGSDVESLVGQPYDEALKRAEIIRYVREAVAPNPYVTEVTEVTVAFAEDKLAISCRAKTIYGEVEIIA